MTLAIREVIDLAHPLFDRMPNIANLPITFWPTETHEETQKLTGGKHCMESRMMLLAEHLGTHLDVPRHCDPDGLTLDQLPLEQTILPGHLLDLTHKKAGESITVDDFLEAEERSGKSLGQGTATICWTGFDKYWGEPGFDVKRPYVSEETAKWLVERGITLFCTDLIGMDEPGLWWWPTHHVWLRNGVCMVQQMTNLDRLQGKDFLLVVAPLKIEGGTACPVRPIALVLE